MSWKNSNIMDQRLKFVAKIFELKHIPAKSTIHAVLDRNGLVNRDKRKR